MAEAPRTHLETAGEQQIELIRGNFKASAIDIDQNMKLSPQDKLEQFHELLRKYEEAEANIPLNQGYKPNDSFGHFYDRVNTKVDYLRRSISGARGWVKPRGQTE